MCVPQAATPLRHFQGNVSFRQQMGHCVLPRCTHTPSLRLSHVCTHLLVMHLHPVADCQYEVSAQALHRHHGARKLTLKGLRGRGEGGWQWQWGWESGWVKLIWSEFGWAREQGVTTQAQCCVCETHARLHCDKDSHTRLGQRIRQLIFAYCAIPWGVMPEVVMLRQSALLFARTLTPQA